MAEVNVKIKAQNQTRTGFQQALGDAQRFGTSASGSLKSAFAGVASDIKSSIGGALAGLASLGAIRSIIDQFGRIQDLSEQFGVSAESLQRFGQLASESGSSIDQVAAAFSRLTINIQKAQGGTGAQADALRELGLSASELANLSPEEAFLRLADALQQAGGSNSSYAAALDLIGNRQRDLIPLLAQGSDAVRAQADAIDVASADVVAKVDEIGDRFGRLGQQIAVGIGPAIAFIGQSFLTLFAVIETWVQKVASTITSGFAAAGQALSGNFSAAGEILRGEAAETGKDWDDLKKKIESIWSTPPPKQGRGAAGQMDAAEEADQGGKTETAIRKQAQDEARIRQQVGEQLKANRRAGMSDDALLEDLKRQEKFFGGDRGGVSETELKRLQVVAQIEQLEKQIADAKTQSAEKAASEAQRALQDRQRMVKDAQRTFEDRAFDAMSPAERQAELDRQMAEFQSGLASGALTPQAASEQAARLMQMFDATNQAPAGFQGSAGASAFQRIGFASNEFFDTRQKEDPTKEARRAADFAKQIYEVLKKGEPLVLNPSNN